MSILLFAFCSSFVRNCEHKRKDSILCPAGQHSAMSTNDTFHVSEPISMRSSVVLL